MNGYKTISLYLGNGFYDDSIENVLRNLIYRLNIISQESKPLEKNLNGFERVIHV